MVAIEEIPEEETTPETTPSTEDGDDDDDNNNNNNEDDDGNAPVDTTPDGWQKLMGEDLVMKVIDTAKSKSLDGQVKEPEAVKPQDAVLMEVIGRIAETRDTTDGPIFQNVTGWLVVIGEGDVLPAVEMAARFMSSGQTALVWSHSKYALGQGTRTFPGAKKKDDPVVVPPSTNVIFEVKVLQIVMDTSRLNPYFTIQKALTKKKIANDIYQHEWCPKPTTPTDPSCETSMNRAIRLYTRAAKEMETLLSGNYFAQVEADHPQRLESQKLWLDVLNNIVAVYLKQEEYHKAKLAAVNVLQQDNKNLKGLLRAAKAALMDPASTLEEVQAALKAAESEITYKQPAEEKEFQRLQVQYKTFQKNYKAATKAMFGNKLSGNNNKSKSTTTTTKKNDNDNENENGCDDTRKPKNDEEQKVKKQPEKEAAADAAAKGNDNGDNDDNDDKKKQAEADFWDTDKNKREDDKNFWKTQLITWALQLLVPLGLWLFYKLFATTERVGAATMASMNNDGREGYESSSFSTADYAAAEENEDVLEL